MCNSICNFISVGMPSFIEPHEPDDAHTKTALDVFARDGPVKCRVG